MGIPSYFSYIIKNYSSIIRHFTHYQETKFGYFYLDCNSIIYDSYYLLEKSNMGEYENFEETLIQTIIEKIKGYIEMVNPSICTYIAFDGVAPFAKMEQQRIRRYKSNDAKIKKLPKISWNTIFITPGTEFMEKLSTAIHMAFANEKRKILVSTSDECGEGEHKLFHHIRKTAMTENNNIIDDNIIIYGLDSDLIMLSIFHLKYSNRIYIIREKPEFGKDILDKMSDCADEFFVLDIKSFADSIVHEMACLFPEMQRIYDYAFMCFLLGNDFLPHFPALNIRTHGIQVLIELYRIYIGKYSNRFFISKETGKIQWRWVRLFIGELAKREHKLLLNEYSNRKRWDSHRWPDKTDDDKEKLIHNIPVIYRAEEKYICPTEEYWQLRYYKTLFHGNPKTKDICINYLEGLEWVLSYYTGECPDWRWKYKYHYPPLFSDLAIYVQHNQSDFFHSKRPCSPPFSPKIQLLYVIPCGMIQTREGEEHYTQYSHLYPTRFRYKWSFCRYLWESHIDLPEIPLSLLEEWEKEK
jgi:5'-3' exoribonuclease 1